MKKAIITILASVLSIVLSHCAPNTVPEKSSLSSIRTVALYGFASPRAYPVTSDAILHDPYYHDELSDELEQRDLHVGAELRAATTETLERNGYTIVDDPATADAILYGNIIDANYDGGVFGSTFTPGIVAEFSLNDMRSHEKLFARRYIYADGTAVGVTMLQPDAKYTFRSDKDVVAHPDLALEGLRRGITAIASALGVALAR